MYWLTGGSILAVLLCSPYVNSGASLCFLVVEICTFQTYLPDALRSLSRQRAHICTVLTGLSVNTYMYVSRTRTA